MGAEAVLLHSDGDLKVACSWGGGVVGRGRGGFSCGIIAAGVATWTTSLSGLDLVRGEVVGTGASKGPSLS